MEPRPNPLLTKPSDEKIMSFPDDSVRSEMRQSLSSLKSVESLSDLRKIKIVEGDLVDEDSKALYNTYKKTFNKLLKQKHKAVRAKHKLRESVTRSRK